MLMQREPNDLALAAAGGDARAFAVLIEGHYDMIFRLSFRLTGDRQEAEDLTQDICAALPAKLGSFRGTSAFRTWLYRLCVNAAHDRRRRATTQRRAADAWGPWEINRRAADRDSADAQDWLTQAMSHLPEALRETLVLIFDDLTHHEVGEVLGISEGTVAWRVSEAKKRLAALAKEDSQ